MILSRRQIARLILPLVGVVGFGWAVFYATVLSRPPENPPQHLALPPVSPYSEKISGAGLIEANTGNAKISVFTAGVVHEIAVTEGDRVEKDAALFRLDDRTARAAVVVAEQGCIAARAQIAEAEANLADQQDQLKRAENLRLGISVTSDRVERLRYAVKVAKARVATLKADLLVKEAALQQANVALDQTTIRAPFAGRVLQVNTHLGEYVAADTSSTAMILGNDSPLYVNVSLDENDLWRLKQGARATGSLRSNRDISFPLTFVRIEPYVIPKASLTGSLSERVDTRILEVKFRIDDDAHNDVLYIGQQVDVFIDAPNSDLPNEGDHSPPR